MDDKALRSFCDAVKAVFCEERSLNIPLHDPWLDDTDSDAVRQCVESGFVSTSGHLVDKLGSELSAILETENVTMVSSGTDGLICALLALGVGHGDIVIVPAISFVATANVVLAVGATPFFVDVDPNTLAPCPSAIKAAFSDSFSFSNGCWREKRTQSRVSAIMLVHALGLPTDFGSIVALMHSYGIFCIEDCAGALTGKIESGKHVGNQGDVSVYSFNGNKIITTGGGGAVATKDSILAGKIALFSNTAKINHPYESAHSQFSMNFRLTNLAAALGLSQLQKLNRILSLKKQLHKSYENSLGSMGYGVCKPSNWLFNFILADRLIPQRAEVLERLVALGFGCRALWMPLNELQHLRRFPSTATLGARHAHASWISFPSGSSACELLSDGGAL